MEITRLTMPSFPALTDAEIATWLRIDLGQEPFAIDMLVASATEYVEGITGLCLGLSTYRIALDGLDDCYRLPLSPVQSVTSVEYRDHTGALIPITDWHFVNGYLHFSGYTSGFPIVTIEAGYSDNTAIPVSLAHAIALLVSEGYNSRESLSDATFKAVDRLCQRYKRFVW
jgi:uncharacterized phiE125 gp8 family phage protein